jgi:hypothetical protein
MERKSIAITQDLLLLVSQEIENGKKIICYYTRLVVVTW